MCLPWSLRTDRLLGRGRTLLRLSVPWASQRAWRATGLTSRPLPDPTASSWLGPLTHRSGSECVVKAMTLITAKPAMCAKRYTQTSKHLELREVRFSSKPFSKLTAFPKYPHHRHTQQSRLWASAESP